MSSKNVIIDSGVDSKNSNTTYVLTNDAPIPNPAVKVEKNPKVRFASNDSSNVFVDTNKSKKKRNYIVDDGPQYDDDLLTMVNRGGRINRKLPSGKSSESESEITTIDDIKKDVEDAGLSGTPIIQLSNPNIDFLILVYPTKLDSIRRKNGMLVTGTKYYQKLKSDLINKTPYAYNIAFDDRFIVKLILQDWIDLFKNMQNLESEVSIRMDKNNFINSNYTIDYPQLIGFIDWFVSKPDYTNFSDKGVLPVNLISLYANTNPNVEEDDTNGNTQSSGTTPPLPVMVVSPPLPSEPDPPSTTDTGEFILLGRTLPDSDTSTLACTSYVSGRGYYSTIQLFNLSVGDLIYDSIANTEQSIQPIPTNGNNKWIALKQNGTGAARSLQISSSGEILDIIDCSI